MSLFDGMSGLLNDTFGGPVLCWTEWGQEYAIQAVFRRDPVEVETDDGTVVLISQPTLKVPQSLAGDLARGILIEAEKEKFRIVNRHLLRASPASDRFLVFELEAVGACS